jgi:hypothetical protein
MENPMRTYAMRAGVRVSTAQNAEDITRGSTSEEAERVPGQHRVNSALSTG